MNEPWILLLLVALLGAPLLVVGMRVVRRRRHTHRAAQTAQAHAAAASVAAAHAALFGTEYLAASVHAAWSHQHREALGHVANPAWCRWLPTDQQADARAQCAVLHGGAAAVAVHNAQFIQQRLVAEAAAFEDGGRPMTERCSGIWRRSTASRRDAKKI